MNTIEVYIKNHSTTLSIGLGLTLIFSFTGCKSPGGTGIAIGAVPGIWAGAEAVGSAFSGGNPWKFLKEAESLFRKIEATAFEASKADEQYAREIARSYVPRTDAPNLAIRTKSSKNKAQPEVVVVNRKTRKVQSSYKLNETPAEGEEIKLINTFDCEYVP